MKRVSESNVVRWRFGRSSTYVRSWLRSCMPGLQMDTTYHAWCVPWVRHSAGWEPHKEEIPVYMLMMYANFLRMCSFDFKVNLDDPGKKCTVGSSARPPDRETSQISVDHRDVVYRNSSLVWYPAA